MLTYSPPKSQLWGHHVRCRSAVTVVERSLRFLDQHCRIRETDDSEFILFWNQNQNTSVLPIVSEINQILGAAFSSSESQDATGTIFQQSRWFYSPSDLLNISGWFDKLAEQRKSRTAVAQTSAFWNITWKDREQSEESKDGDSSHFGIHLGVSHRIATTFVFRDHPQYLRVKQALQEIELATLSDKYLRF